MLSASNITFMGCLVLGVHLLGVLNAAHAIMNVRLSQSAVAWSICLVTFPWLTIPLYWVLGRRKFHGYADVYRRAYAEYDVQASKLAREGFRYISHPPASLSALDQLARRFTDIPFTANNQAQLLVDGEQTYAAMLAAIQAAQAYILFQSYIINDDETGRRFQQALIDQAQQGVRIYVMYDEIGSSKLTRTYLRRLRNQGIQVSPFNSTKGIRNRFQLNFRNHRKILVVDGQTGFIGGLNIGDEYLGKNPKYGPWRDTHMQLQGPAVNALQLSFLKDWYWAVRSVPKVYWQAEAEEPRGETALVLPTGPADELEFCSLFFNSLIPLAQTRLWIATPYFVPDEPTLSALKAAALRGVDVRILLPGRPDHLLVYLSAFSYYTELQATGIKLYRYHPGFMHQKVLLVDHQVAGVGTVNLDNRSFLLNFEIMAFLTQGAFLQHVEAMLDADLNSAKPVDLTEYSQRPFWFRLAVRVARLLAPLQ